MSILPPADLLTLRANDLETEMDALKTATDQKLSSGQEPVSGEQGKGSAGEPFDQGNAEGKEGAAAPAKEGMTGALDATKRKAEELTGKGT